MTYEQVADLLATIDLPFTYWSFPENEAPTLPYFVFYYPSNDDLSADNINYQTIVNMNLELYSENKDFTLEKRVEDVFTSNGIYFQKSEQYIRNERMHEVLYEVQLIITEE